MSSYAALVSLLRILGTLHHPGRLLISSNRNQLQSLHYKAMFLLDFLDNSTTRKPALEIMMRDAAYKAEDLIESLTFQILDSDSRSLRTVMKFCFRHFRFRYALLVLIVSSNLFPPTFTQAEAVPVPIQVFLLRIVAPVLLVTAICMICAVFIYLLDSPAINHFLVQDNQEFRRLLYDFDVIMKEVDQIKKARRDVEMSAHAALISLRRVLDCSRDRTCHNRSQLESLRQNVSFLLDFLGNASTYMKDHKSELEIVEVKTRDAVYKAEALIEFKIPRQFTQDSYRRSFYGLVKVSLLDSLPFLPIFNISTIILLRFTNYVQTFLASFPQIVPLWSRVLVAAFIVIALSFAAFALFTIGVGVVPEFLAANSNSNSGELENEELRLVIDDFSAIMRNATEIKAGVYPSNFSSTTADSSKWDYGGSSSNVVVGLDRDLGRIMDILAQNSSKLEVVSIVGMGGIGKTTLAKLVYEDPYIVEKYDIRAWITIPQDYSLEHTEHSLRQVLLGLLGSAKKLTKEIEKEDNAGLALHLHQNLMGRTYFIVMDNVWHVKIWDRLKRYLPEDCVESRVLLTSQLSQLTSHHNINLHQMQCLNDKESWDLLREKVFGAETCPLEMEPIGKEIAGSCKGLPLAIVVIGGLLCKDNRRETWSDIAQKSRQSKERCLEILGLSYKHLPYHLRPCFLYMGVFLGDSEVPVSRLLSLWVAEGFLKPSASKTLEEVAEENLKDLIARNLIMVCKKSCSGKIRTCSMHGLLRDVCQQKARKENFLHVVDRGGRATLDRRDETPRRLTIRSDALRVDARHDFISRYYNVRSFLCTSQLFDYHPVAYLGFVYLRVVDVLVVHLSKFPVPIIRLLLLRYLALHCDGPLPPSMSKLQNLETIILHHCSFRKYPLFPKVVWSMPCLRHIYVKPGCYLSDPLSFRLPWKSFALEHLHTLVGVRNFKWSNGIIKRIPNLKKLGISYDVSSSVDWSAYQLESLQDLIHLESLKIVIKYNDEGSGTPPKLAFPQELRKLSVSGCWIRWAGMTATIGALPNLEALKLKCKACRGSSWKTVEGKFPKLIFLQLEEMTLRRWKTEAHHFPRLHRVVIKSCGRLVKIPCVVGDISTLEMIELVGCRRSAEKSAKRIQEEQEENGNEGLKVTITKTNL